MSDLSVAIPLPAFHLAGSRGGSSPKDLAKSKLDHAASLISSDAAATRKATPQHRPTNRKSINTCYDALYLRRKVASDGTQTSQIVVWTVRFQPACSGIFENSIDRLARAFAVEAFCGLEKV